MNLIKGLYQINHLQAFLLFKKIAWSSKANLIYIKKDSALDILCARLYLSYDDQNNIILGIEISDRLQSHNVRRLYNCFRFWVPYSIDLFHTLNRSFYLSLNASDWSHSTFLSMTSESPDNLIPDEYSMVESNRLNTINFPSDYPEFRSEWLQRKPHIFWRGSTTGSYLNSINDLKDLERVRLCLKFKNTINFDFKITSVVQNNIPEKLLKQWLKENRIIDKQVNEDYFRKYKYHPDIPGNNKKCGSWGVIRKYLRGNLVFRPPHLSSMLYDKYIEPWVHFIPIDHDWSDLYEKYLWAENNPEQASLIAWNGLSMAKKYLSALKQEFIQVATNNTL